MDDQRSRRVDLRILGPLELVVGGRPVHPGGVQARVVLARLAADAGRVVSVDRLEEALWGDDAPAAAAVTLRAYVSRLRSHLEGAAPAIELRTVAPGYELHVNSDACDATRFERGARDGRASLERGDVDAAAETLARGLAEWRGEVLPELAGRGFVDALAARLDGLRLTAQEDLFEARIAQGGAIGVLSELERHAEDHPTRERAWELRMRALYLAGRQADALAAYARVRRLLDEELGVEPGPGLEDLQARILRHQLDAPPNSTRRDRAGGDGATVDVRPPTARSSLPALRDRFVGRETEVRAIHDALVPGQVVTLVGVAGVGKTRLALEAATRLAPPAGRTRTAPPDAAFVDLATLPAGSSPAAVVAHVASATGISLRSGDASVDELTRRLAPVDVVVLLDNCEHVVDAVTVLVARLMDGSPVVRVLATSRAPLRVPGEVVIAVDPLPIDGGDDAGGALQLLADRLDRIAGAGPRDVAAMRLLCDRLDGLPLAIELAAAQARGRTVDEIAERLGDRLGLLRSWSRVATPRHATLRAAIDWSHDLLTANERVVFASLASFRSGFGMKDGVRLAVAAGIDTAEAEAAIERLVDASLVTRAAAHPAGALSMLETVRAYASERLDDAPFEPAVRSAHAELVTEAAEAMLAARDTPAEGAAFERVDRSLPDVRAALDWSLRRRPGSLGPRLARAMGGAWRIRGNIGEGIRETEAALELLGSPHAELAGDEQDATALRAGLLANLGMFLVRATDLARAMASLREAADLARHMGDRRLEGTCLHGIAFAQRSQGDTAAAKETLATAIPLRRDVGDLGGLAWSIGNLADIAVTEGDYTLADRLYAEGALVVAAAGDPPGLTVAYLESRARLALLRDDPATALVLAERGLEAAQRFGDLWHVGLCTAVRGAARRRVAAADDAEADGRAAFAVFSRLAEAGGRAEAAELVAGTLLDRDAPREAALLFAAAAAARTAAGVPVPPAALDTLVADTASAKRQLGEVAYEAASTLGAAMSLDAAMAAATLAGERR